MMEIESEDNELDQPSEEHIDIITELTIAKKKYLKRMVAIKEFSQLKGREGIKAINNGRKALTQNSVVSIDSLVDYFNRYKRLKPSQVFFAKKLIRNAAHMELMNLERDKLK